MMIRIQLAVCLLCGFVLACSSQQFVLDSQEDADKQPVSKDVPFSAEDDVKKVETFIGNLSPEVKKGIGLQEVEKTEQTKAPDPASGRDPASNTTPVAFQVQVTPSDTEHARTQREIAKEQGVRLNFDNASIYDVTKVVSEITEKSFLIAEEVEDGGKITIFSEELLMPDQVFELYKSALEMNGLLITEVGGFYKITLNQAAQKQYMPLDSEFISDEDRLITRIVKLQHVRAKAVKDALKALAPEGKDFVSYPDDNGNTLIITDTAANVRKVLDILDEIDVSQYTGQYIEIFPIQHADLTELIHELNQILSLQEETLPAVTPSQPAQQPAQQQEREAVQPEESVLVPPGTRTRLYPISRLNALVVSTNNREVIELVKKWIAILDQPATQEGLLEEDAFDDGSPYLYFVKYAKAEDLSYLLAQVYEEEYQQQQPQQQPQQENQEQPQQQQEQVPPLPEPDEGDPIFIPDKKSNTIIIKASPEQYADIMKLVEKLDQRPLQVLIDVIIAEVTWDDSEILGVRGMMMGQEQMTTGGGTTSVETTGETIFGSVAPENAEGFLYTVNAPGWFLAKLRALATENRVKVLSDPHILVRNNEEAVMNVGGRIPIKKTTTDADDETTESVEYQKIGTILTVTPQINFDGDVVIDIKQEISAVGQENFGDTGAASFNTREAETVVVTQDGYPIVIGGLIDKRDEVNETGVPLLKDLPLLGRLFRYTDKTNRQSDLFILLTPRVIRNPGEGWMVTDDVLQKRVKKLEELFNREKTDSDKLKDFLRNPLDKEP